MKTSPEEMRALMEPTGLKFRIDDDGDAACIISGLGPDGDRTHMVWVTSAVDQWGLEYADRDVWARVAELAELPKSYELLLKLLQVAGQKKGGSLVVLGPYLNYRFDCPVTASAAHLRDSIFLCAEIADELERALTSSDDH